MIPCLLNSVRALPLVLFFIILSCSVHGQELKGSSPGADQPIPAGFAQQLDSLRRTDNLEEWLYHWMDYVKEAPPKRLSLLSVAESSAWRQGHNDRERLAWFYLLANLGYYQLYAGNILRSIDAYERAYRFYFERPLAQADVLEYVLKPLGNNYTRLGDYDRAFFIQEKSLAIALSEKNHAQLAAIYNNLAISSRWNGRLQEAAGYCQKGLLQVEKNTALNGLLLSTLADILMQSKQGGEAEICAEQAISILLHSRKQEPSNNNYWLMSAYEVHGNLRKEKGDNREAFADYEKALSIADHYFKGERKREKAKLKLLIGDVMLHMHQPARAMQAFDDALTILVPAFHPKSLAFLPEAKDLYGENTLLDALAGKAKSLLLSGNKVGALQCFLLSFEADRKLRQEFFGHEAKEQQQKENRSLAEQAIQTAYELWIESRKKEYANDMLLIAENSKAQLLLDDMTSNLNFSRMKTKDTLLDRQARLIEAIAYYEREEVFDTEGNKAAPDVKGTRKNLQYELSLLQKIMKGKYPMTDGRQLSGSLFEINDLLRQLPDSIRVIEFFFGEQAIYIMAAGRTGVLQIRKLQNAGKLQLDIKDFISRYFQQGPVNMINHPQDYCEMAFKIYQMLCDSMIYMQGRYLIVPDGMIGYLPFDALLTEPVYHPDIDRWPFLIRRGSLSFAYSLQTWQQQVQTSKPGKLFAGFFISYDSSFKKSIPAVVKEGEDIRALVKGKFYDEREATCERFKQSLGQVNILHISTHSFLQAGDNLPVLQLADGRFFLFELYGHAIQPQLVVLSACRTGYGMLSEGEGIISLSRGFAGSGAGGIVAGLWNLNDESTAALMGYFYQQMETGNHPAAALRLAKLKWLEQRHDNPFMKLPYFWAGSIYCGNDQSISIDSNDPAVSYYLLEAAGLSCLIFIYFLVRLRLKAVSLRQGTTPR